MKIDLRPLRAVLGPVPYFATGSRVIGANRIDSDLDIMVYDPYGSLEPLSFAHDPDRVEGYDGAQLALTFRLPPAISGLPYDANILTTQSKDYFAAWWDATLELMESPELFQTRELRAELFRLHCGD